MRIKSILFGGVISIFPILGGLQVSHPFQRGLEHCANTKSGGQITPFGIKTPDGETLYAWHILPLPLYLKNEEVVATQPAGYCNDFRSSESFKLLKEDPKAKLILYCKFNTT